MSSLMSNFSIAQNALQTSLDSSGSAMKEHEKWSQSLEAKLLKLKATWQSLSQSFLSSDFLKTALDGVISLVNAIDWLIDTIGVLPAFLTGFTFFKSFDNKGLFKTLNNDLDGFTNKLGIANKSISELMNAFKSGNSGGFKGFFSGLKSIKELFSSTSSDIDVSAISRYLDLLDSGKDQADAFKIAMDGVSGATQDVVRGAGNNTAALRTMTTATNTSKVAMIGAKAAAIAFNTAITMGISLLIDFAISGIMKLVNAEKELAEKVEEVTSKYKEQHDELKKIKGDYDTTNESSMISKYEKLSKGVNSLGENISLTSDEYSEYQSIVDEIASRFPELVTGYNSVGTAILNNATNVDTLTEAYKNLLIEQNKEVLDTGEDIFKDFKNDVEDYKIEGSDSALKLSNYIEALGIADSENIESAVNNLSYEQAQTLSELLENEGYERDKIGTGDWGFESTKDHIIRVMQEDADGVKSALGSALDDVNAYADELLTYSGAYIENKFLTSYSHLSDKSQNILNQIVSGFDADFFSQFKSVDEIDTFINDLLKAFDGLSDGNTSKLENAFDLKTSFNNGEVSYGEYVKGIEDAGKIIENLGLDENVESQLKLSIGLDEEGIVEEYDNLLVRLTGLNRDGTNAIVDNHLGLSLENAKNLINELSASELQALTVMIEAEGEVDWENISIDELRKQIEEEAKLIDALNFEANIEVDKTALEAFNTALEESASAMGLSSESIDSLKSKYADLDSYDSAKLFEKTTNGVKVNREELAKLEKEYNNLTKTEVEEHLETLTDKYNDVTAEIDKCSSASERASLLAERDTYANKIEELATYQAQLEGVTGAYQRWIDAQNTPEDYEGYEGIATSRENVKDEIDRGFIGNATKEYIDLLSGKDLQGGTIDDYANAWGKLDDKVTGAGHSILDFFTVNDDGDITATGIDRFFKSVQTDFNGSVAKFNKETKKWTYDFSQENLEKIQKEWGMGIDAIGIMLEAAASAGYDVDWGGILDGIDLDTSNFETLVETAESAQKAFNKLDGVEDVNFNFTATGVDEATSEMEKAKKTYIDLITNDDGTINLEANGADEMRVILATLLIQKQQLEDSNISIDIDTSKLDESQQDIANAIQAVQNFRTKYKNLEIAVSTGEGIEEAKEELNTALGELQGLGDAGIDIAAQLILGEGTDGSDLKSKVDAAITAVGDKNIEVGCKLDETDIGSLNSQLLTNFTPEATVKITKIDDSLVGEYTSTEKTANGKVKWDNDTSLVVEYQNKVKESTGTVKWGNNTDNVKTAFSADGTVKWTSGNKVKVDVISEATGTANASGSTFGRAFARGNWGINGNGVALGGELGQELVVRDGRFFTIGDNGAEFFKYKKNDIVFNAAQTESLFKYGGIKGANPRGKMLYSGTAFANGSISYSGRAFGYEVDANVSESNFASNRKKKSTTIKADKVVVESKDGKSSGNSTNKSTGKTYNKSSNSSKDTSNEFEETFDWVEIAISRIERAIDKLDQKANNVYKKWSTRNNALTDEIKEVENEIALQQKAYDRYIKQANSVGLSSSYAEKVRNGTIDISTITDEKLAEKIKDYQTW